MIVSPTHWFTRYRCIIFLLPSDRDHERVWIRSSECRSNLLHRDTHTTGGNVNSITPLTFTTCSIVGCTWKGFDRIEEVFDPRGVSNVPHLRQRDDERLAPHLLTISIIFRLGSEHKETVILLEEISFEAGSEPDTIGQYVA